MDKEERNAFDTDTEAYMMLNAMLRIAKDLEKALVGIYATAGLLGLIAFIMIYRLLDGR